MTHLCQWANFQPRKWPNIEQTNCQSGHAAVFLNGPTRPLYHLFLSFQSHITNFYNKKVCEKMYIHPVYGAGIQTHDLWNVSLLP